ncbi:MAG TPA: VacJ family lipoprotein [Stenotrophomonas sp.]|jgi:phospholipid-binding lipoprotein MlaA
MNVFRYPLIAIVAVLAACSSQAPKSAPSSTAVPAATTTTAAAGPSVLDATTTTAAPTMDASSVAAGAADTGPAASTSAPAATGVAPTEAEDDFAALYGGPTPTTQDPTAGGANLQLPSYDPWERYNRGMHRFNMTVDRAVARPLATAYAAVVPQPARLGVANFFDNLRAPVTVVNQLLQGHPVWALQTLGRFVMNSTLGVGGLMDPASAAKIPRRSEDFGQTLGVWGWRNSRFFELPFFGPRTVRDTFGLAGDMPLSPLRQIESDQVRIGLQGLQLVDTRAQLLALDSLRDEAVDEYALTRDAWLQRRNYQINRDRRHWRGRNDEVPEYLKDEKDTTVPVDAMPMPDFGN